MQVPVTSKDNQWIKEWRRLSAEAKYRRECGRFAIEGVRLCGDALASGVHCGTVLYTAQAAETYADTVQRLLEACDQAVEITPELARYIADTTHPQGVFCIANALDNSFTLDKIDMLGIYAALEDIQDPGNMGTILRTAEALGVQGVLLSGGCCDVYNPKVLRSSMGGVFRLPVLQVACMEQAIAALQQHGLIGYACVVDAAARPITEVKTKGGTLVVIGNEGNGLRPETVAACAQQVTIPMSGRAESLNASMAAGIALWEMTRPGQ